MKACILTVGDEILIGQITDTNSAWMAEKLTEIGVDVALQLSVSDTIEDIIEGMKFANKHADVVLMTGGLGPTKDDITKKALAQYYDCGLTFSEVSFERTKTFFAERNITLTEAHHEQFYLPDLATIITNERGTAPGMWFEVNGKYLCSMPGVPHEMKYLMTHGVLARLVDMTDSIYRQTTIRTAGIGESSLADLVEPVLAAHPTKVAYLPSLGQVRLRLSLMGTDAHLVESTLSRAVAESVAVIRPHVYGYDDDLLEAHVGQLLLSANKSMATAESCTGGYLAHLLTSIPGSSAYFKGSVIAYANAVKQQQLDVPQETLDDVGAVSEETVRAMVTGVINNLDVDIGIATSGVAGPSGGTIDKPVGTVWIAVGDRNSITARRFMLTKNRILNIKYTAVYALDMLRNFL